MITIDQLKEMIEKKDMICIIGSCFELNVNIIQHICPDDMNLTIEPEREIYPTEIKYKIEEMRNSRYKFCIITNSPLVVNEFDVNEVVMIIRDGSNYILRPLTEIWNVEERLKVYCLGEVWISWTNGHDERSLFEKPPIRVSTPNPEPIKGVRPIFKVEGDE